MPNLCFKKGALGLIGLKPTILKSPKDPFTLTSESMKCIDSDADDMKTRKHVAIEMYQGK